MTRDQIQNVCRLLDVPMAGALVYMSGCQRDEEDTPVATVPGRVAVLSEALQSGAVTPEEVSEALHLARRAMAEGSWPGTGGINLPEATVVLSQALTGFDRAA